MRIKVIHKPPVASIDGLRLDLFEPGYEYEVGNSVGALFLAERWAVPVALEEPGPIVPFSEVDPFEPAPYRDHDAPANLTRENYPPYLNDRLDVAADFERHRKRRKPGS